MRAILDIRTNKVLRVCNSINSSMRQFAMLQIERDGLRKICKATGASMPKRRDFRLAICELATARYIGDIVPGGEMTIIHQEK